MCRAKRAQGRVAAASSSDSWRLHKQGCRAALSHIQQPQVLPSLPVSSRMMLGCLPFLPSGRRGPAATAAATVPASRAASSTAAGVVRMAALKSAVCHLHSRRAMPLAQPNRERLGSRAPAGQRRCWASGGGGQGAALRGATKQRQNRLLREHCAPHGGRFAGTAGTLGDG